MVGESALPALVLLVASAIAAITDVWRFKVYNVLTIPLLLSGLGYQAIAGGLDGHGGAEAFLSGLAGAMFGFVVFVMPYLFGAVGAGDVKFLVAIGAWLGMPLIANVALIGCILAGFYSVGVMVYYGRFKATWTNVMILFYRFKATWRLVRSSSRAAGMASVQEMAKKPDRRRRLIPFSAMMTLGLVITLIWRAWH